MFTRVHVRSYHVVMCLYIVLGVIQPSSCRCRLACFIVHYSWVLDTQLDGYLKLEWDCLIDDVSIE